MIRGILYGIASLILLTRVSSSQRPQAYSGESARNSLPSGLDTVSPPRNSAGDAAAFDRADRRARTVIAQIRCAQRVGGLRRSGAFGPLDSLGRRGLCVTAGDRQVGIFFDSDTLFERVSRLAAVNLSTSARYTESLDTAGILAVGRAIRTAQLRGADAFRRAERPFAPIGFRFEPDSIEVWLIPVAVLSGSPLTVGGERGYVFTGDGRSVAREIEHFDSMRVLAAPDTGVVRIPSGEDAVPTMTELLLANVLHDAGRRISIDMRHESAALAGEGRTAIWVHSPRDRTLPPAPDD